MGKFATDTANLVAVSSLRSMVCKIEQRHQGAATILTIPSMVESNFAEERLARIEQILETLERESAVMKAMTAKIIAVVVEAQPAPSPRRGPARQRIPKS